MSKTAYFGLWFLLLLWLLLWGVAAALWPTFVQRTGLVATQAALDCAQGLLLGFGVVTSALAVLPLAIGLGPQVRWSETPQAREARQLASNAVRRRLEACEHALDAIPAQQGQIDALVYALGGKWNGEVPPLFADINARLMENEKQTNLVGRDLTTSLAALNDLRSRLVAMEGEFFDSGTRTPTEHPPGAPYGSAPAPKPSEPATPAAAKFKIRQLVHLKPLGVTGRLTLDYGNGNWLIETPDNRFRAHESCIEAI